MIDVTPTPTPTPRTKKAFDGRRHTGNKYVYVSMDVLAYSIHVQFFSHNQSLLSLSLSNLKSNYYKKE